MFIQLPLIAQMKEVKFNITTEIPDSVLVYISGNNDSLGNWEPSAVPLIKTGLNTWSRTFKFKEGMRLEYKFTLGDWEHEALNDIGSVPDNNILKVENDTTLNFEIQKWGNQRRIYGQITGTTEFIRDFKPDGLKSRDIIIWLPPDYNTSDQRYPVLYAQDGQNIIDPATSSFGIDWQMDETADSLIRKKEIEPIIIVGIYNTSDRYAEYSDTDTGHIYINSIINQLKPLIDSRYRTLPDKKNTAVIGSSMGGLISFIMMWEYPEVFSKGACLSPAFAYRNFDYTVKVREYAGARKDLRIYIDNGGIGLETELQPGVEKMIGILKDLGYPEEKALKWVFASDAEHNESAWAKRFPEILKYIFGKD